MSNIVLVVCAVSTVLTCIIAFQAYRAYRCTYRDYLLNFAAGFALLTLSYGVVVLVGLRVPIPTCCGNPIDDMLRYPPRIVMQTVGFILIALAYSRTPRARLFLTVLLMLLNALVILVLAPQITVLVPDSVNSYLFILNCFVLAYVLYHMLKITRPTELVFLGFLMLTVGQYTAFINSLDSGLASYYLDLFVVMVGLAILFVSFIQSQRKRLVSPAPKGMMTR